MENNKSTKKKLQKNEKQTETNKKNIRKNSNLLEINTEFDESISFSHYCSIYRKFGVDKEKSKMDYIPFIMTVEFTYSYSEELRSSKEVDKQSIENIISYIKKFSNSIDEKYIKTFLDNIKTFSEIIGIEKTSNLLIPSLARIVDDSFSLKNHFLKVLLPFIDYLCSNGDEGLKILKNNIMNIIQELYNPRNKRDVECYKNEDYQNLLFKNFIKIAKALIPKDKEKQILGLILSFGYEDEKNTKKFGDEHVILCVKLISELTEIFGRECTENYLLPQLIYFADDKNEKIKKEVLLALPNICDVVSFEVINTKIYDLIKRVLNVLNPSWIIKKIIVDILAKIIKAFKRKSGEEENENKINDKKSAKKFVSLIEKLIKDKEKYVRYNILEKIGPIIEPLNKEELSLELLKFYKNSVEEYYTRKKRQLPSGMTVGNNLLKKKNIEDDVEINSFVVINSKSDNEIEEIKKKLSEENMGYYFAYNFPAILYCYGSEHWPELKSLYIDFCFETDIKIRRSIVVSFHEISKIIGQKITENELLPIYDTFLNSNDKIEKNLSIRYLPKILMQVSKEKKKRYFKYLEAASIFIDNIGSKVRNFNFINWKNKLDVIEGILCYYNLYDNDIIYKSIFPQCISFCLDDIYKVRKTSSKVLASLIEYLYNINYKKEQLFKLIDAFALHKKFHQRINFIKMCKIFLKNKNLYEEKIKNLLIDLVDHERIRDVKICLSKVLKRIIGCDKEILYKDQNIHQICYRLKMDNLPIINNIFNDVNIKYNGFINKTNDIKKKYFKGDNKYFIEEFKIELEKKSSIFFIDRSNKKLVSVQNKKETLDPPKEDDKQSNEIKTIIQNNKNEASSHYKDIKDENKIEINDNNFINETNNVILNNKEVENSKNIQIKENGNPKYDKIKTDDNINKEEIINKNQNKEIDKFENENAAKLIDNNKGKNETKENNEKDDNKRNEEIK